MLKLLPSLLLLICCHFSYSQGNLDLKIDTFFIDTDDIMLPLPDGDYVCNLVYDSPTTKADYYKIKGNDSLVYCIQYHNGIIFKEGFYASFPFDKEYNCWGMAFTWKYYDSLGNFSHIEFIPRDINVKGDTFIVEFESKFKVLYRK